MIFARLAVVAALAGACWFPGAAVAESRLIDALPHITVVGHSHTEIVPDFATLSLAIVTEKPNAAGAAAANAQAAQAVVDEIKAQGIDPKDIQTSEISLTPVYDNVSDALGHPSSQKLRGYQARNGLTIRVRDISKAGALAARLIDSGANEFQGLSFGASHEDEILRQTQ